jgi:hypothetical protein
MLRDSAIPGVLEIPHIEAPPKPKVKRKRLTPAQRRLCQLAGVLESERKLRRAGVHQFDMTTWISAAYDESCNKCGTAACIGGTASILFNVRAGDYLSYSVAAYLGLTVPQSDKLFRPWNARQRLPKGTRYWSKVTGKQAAKTIRHFVATGEVDWRTANATA